MPALTYDNYKEFILRTLRRDGDTVLKADLDEYIAQAEARLTRDLRVFKQDITTTLSVTDDEVDLPAGFRRLRAAKLEANSGKMLPLTLTSVSEIQGMQTATTADIFPYYAIRNQDVMLLAGSFDASSPRDLTLTYFSKVQSYQDTDAQPLRDHLEYTDLYDAAVLAELPLPLMTDERLAAMSQVYLERLASANGERAEAEFSWDTPLQDGMPLI